MREPQWRLAGCRGQIVSGKPSTKQLAWAIFDRIVADAAETGYTNPWIRDSAGELRFEPDFVTLGKLLGVPLFLEAPTQSGVPALALDVWVAYELRRAGFDVDAVWPRAVSPRVLPAPISNLLAGLPGPNRAELIKRLGRASPPKGTVAASANILGKNYLKQVDVVMSDWRTGPELLISTKRMDSSFGKNAANRVEESYGDAKNLRLRHPLSALGFVYGLRTTIYDKEGKKALWLLDLLEKLGREDDAYHAVALLMLDYDKDPPADGDGDEATLTGIDGIAPDETSASDEDLDSVEPNIVENAISSLPAVRIAHDMIPPDLSPGRFLAVMVDQVLRNSPIDFHEDARSRRGYPFIRDDL